MGKSSPRNPLWPDWFDGEKIDEREQERYGNPGRKEDSRRYGGLFAGERDGG